VGGARREVGGARWEGRGARCEAEGARCGARRLTRDGGEDGRPIRAEAAPRRQCFRPPSTKRAVRAGAPSQDDADRRATRGARWEARGGREARGARRELRGGRREARGGRGEVPGARREREVGAARVRSPHQRWGRGRAPASRGGGFSLTVFPAAEHAAGPPSPRSGFGEIPDRRWSLCLRGGGAVQAGAPSQGKADRRAARGGRREARGARWEARGSDRLTSDGGEDGRPLRAEAAPRRQSFRPPSTKRAVRAGAPSRKTTRIGARREAGGGRRVYVPRRRRRSMEAATARTAPLAII